MVIRKMREDDYDEVLALWLSCKGMGLNDVDDSREGISSFIERNPTTCLVAQEEDEMVGVILVGFDGRRAYVYHAAVHPSKRGLGIGRALVESVVDELAGMGVSKLSLVVFAHNEAGNAFWEHLGFHARTDLAYRDKPLVELVRTDT